MSESYEQYKESLKAEQGTLTKEEVLDTLEAEYKLDLDNIPTQQHRWVKRGVVISCENAGHPNHRHFLTQRTPM